MRHSQESLCLVPRRDVRKKEGNFCLGNVHETMCVWRISITRQRHAPEESVYLAVFVDLQVSSVNKTCGATLARRFAPKTMDYVRAPSPCNNCTIGERLTSLMLDRFDVKDADDDNAGTRDADV